MAEGGSVATLVAAALETSGYKAQALVLTQLGDMLTSIALVLFVGTAIGAIVTIGLLGHYRAGVWFFIGAPLFYWLIGTTVTASGADWQYGAYDGDEARMYDVINSTPTAGEVSWFFNAYNRVISQLYQDLIRVITDDGIKRQIMFTTRQRIVDHMFSSKILDGGLLQLVHYGLQGQCSEYLNAARTLAYGNRDRDFQGSSEWKRADTYLAQVKANEERHYSVYIREGTPSYSYVVDLLTSVQTANPDGKYNLNCGSDALNNFATKPPHQILSGPLTCEQVWCLSGLGIAKEANQIKLDAEKKFIKHYADVENQYPDIYAEIWNDIAVKMSPPQVNGSNPPDVSQIPVIIGGILLRKALLQDPRSQMFSDVGNHSGVYARPYNFNLQMTEPQLQDVLRKMNNHQQAVALQYETFTFAMSLPYIQGIILYALSIAFPFFAALVVIPGKASSLFTWMTLWAWAKSWDVGFAFVTVVDDILWNLMPHRSVFNPLADSNHGPTTVFEAAFSSDPAYTLSNYYGLLSVMLMGVPMITAQAAFGARKAIAGTLITGLKGMGEKLGGAAADWTAMDQIGRINYLREGFIEDYVVSRVNRDEAAHDLQIQQTRNNIDNAYDTAQAKQESGGWKMFAAIGIGILGVALCATGVGAAAGVAIIGGAVAIGGAVGASGYSEWKEGKLDARASNAARVQWRESNAEMHKYAANKTTEVRNMDAIRAGLSNRGEFWNLAEMPAAVPQQLQNINATLLTQLERNSGRRYSEEVSGAADAVQAGLDIATRGRLRY